jgi:predicted aspartyl protease
MESLETPRTNVDLEMVEQAKRNGQALSVFHKYAGIRRSQWAAIISAWEPLDALMDMDYELTVDQLYWIKCHQNRLMSIISVFLALRLEGQYKSPSSIMTLDRLWLNPNAAGTMDTTSLLRSLNDAERYMEMADGWLKWLREQLDFDNTLQKLMADLRRGHPPPPCEWASSGAKCSQHRPIEFLRDPYYESFSGAWISKIEEAMETLHMAFKPIDRQAWRNDVAMAEESIASARGSASLLRLQTHVMLIMPWREPLRQAGLDRSQPQQTCGFSEPHIEVFLNEEKVSAFPDTGASGNFVSLTYVERHGLEIDRTSSSNVRLGNGKTIDTIGTITSLVSFAGEKSTHALLFNVLRRSVHDVVLGSPFLKATETLTRYAHRIERRWRKAFSHRVCALGTPQRVSGRLNAVQVDAVPDTGAEVSLMSASFASQQGFEIDTDAQHCVLLEFADGSTANATGLVKDLKWKYGGSEAPCRIDVYVLPELSVDLLLGDEFLVKTDAFVAHEDQFWSGDDVETQDMTDEKAIVWVFWIIKLVRKAVKHRRSLGQRMLSSYCSVSRHQELTQMRRQSESIFFEQP